MGTGNWLQVIDKILTGLFIVSGAIMTFFILLQEGKGGGLTALGGTKAAGVEGVTNPIRRATVYLAVLFFVLAIVLGILNRPRESTKIPGSSSSTKTNTMAPAEEKTLPIETKAAEPKKEEAKAVEPPKAAEPKKEETKAVEPPKAAEPKKEETKAVEPPKAAEPKKEETKAVEPPKAAEPKKEETKAVEPPPAAAPPEAAKKDEAGKVAAPPAAEPKN